MERTEHPSFGFLRASRVSGHASLFDSAIQHHHYVEVTVGTAVQEWRHGETHVYGKDEILKVAMSEAQFAAPCTLTRLDGKSVEPPPADINTRETFENHVKDKAESIAGSLKEALTALGEIETGKRRLTKTEIRDAKALVETASRELLANMPYLLRVFAEQMENLTERAKADINAYAVMAGQRLTGADAPKLNDESQ